MRRKTTEFPENLEVKAKTVLARVSITDIALAINKSRVWVERVLNGYEKGTETIELVNSYLEKIEKEKKAGQPV